jgi:hypothetical protein
MELPLNCANCAHFDGDGHCALPMDGKLITGYIPVPALVVCVEHEPKRDED